MSTSQLKVPANLSCNSIDAIGMDFEILIERQRELLNGIRAGDHNG